MMQNHDLISLWSEFKRRDNDGQARDGDVAGYAEAYANFCIAVGDLAQAGRLQDIVTFSLDAITDGTHKEMMEDIVGLVTRCDHQTRDGKGYSTRMFAIPISGARTKMSTLHRAEGFIELLTESPLFPDQCQIGLVGVMGIEEAASISFDALSEMTEKFDLMLGGIDPQAINSLKPALDRLLIEDGGVEREIVHGLMVGFCRHEMSEDTLETVDSLEFASAETDALWMASFDEWVATNSQFENEPWMSTPPAKWEYALPDAIVLSSKIDLALNTRTPFFNDEIPRATQYRIRETRDAILIGASTAEGEDMGTVRFPTTLSWALPNVIQEWQAWGCLVEFDAEKPSAPRKQQLN